VGIGPGNVSTVSMTINSAGLPIHRDATLTIKPRLVLEGNGYIDLDPGTVQAPVLHSGDAIPETQTSVPVQLDQVLDTFTLPTRDALQQSVSALADGLGGSGPVGDTGYGALRSSIRALDHSSLDLAHIARAAQGTAPLDVRRAVGSSADLVSQIAQNPAALAGAVSSFNQVIGTIASDDRALAGSVETGDALLQSAPAALTRLNAALPELTSFANDLTPALKVAPSALGAGSRLLRQVAVITRPAVLPTLVDELAPVTAELPTLEQELGTLFGYTTPVTDCITTHVVPVLDDTIQDGPNTTGDPVWLDLMHTFAGFTSASTSYDGNGGTFRAGLAEGGDLVQGILPGIGKVVGDIDPNATVIRPAWLGYGIEPPFRPDVPCATQTLPTLNVAAAPGPAWATKLVHPLNADQTKAFDSLAEMGFGASTRSGTPAGAAPAHASPPPRHAASGTSQAPATPSPASGSSGGSVATGTSTSTTPASPLAPIAQVGASVLQKLGSLLRHG
ncbi:MAG TPA: hypothetical protein VG223_01275, partial [Solirubrobacteraceae bacterium]|nr:hypothetical protein [Solirubrobacteraceae bacterium]